MVQDFGLGRRLRGKGSGLTNGAIEVLNDHLPLGRAGGCSAGQGVLAENGRERVAER